MAPLHPSARMLLGSTDGDTGPGRTGYWGEYKLAPSELPCQQQEEHMMELGQELSQHMNRVGLREGPSPARPPPRARNAPADAHSHRLGLPQLSHGGQQQQSDQERTHQ